ncbi:MAG: hypothetical protein RL338_1748 [Chloroflexota bacterium]
MAIASKEGPATVSDVARAAGVSTATVSRVLNSPGLVAEATRHRVLAAVGELGYLPNVAARRLAGAETGTLGLLLPELSGPFFSELLSGVEEAARAAGLHLLVAATEPDDTDAPLAPPIDPRSVDGTIVLPHAVESGLVDQIARSGAPIVLVERTHPTLPTVSFDGAGGAAAAVRHLVRDHGARRVACLAGPAEAEASRIREVAYAAELIAAGIEPDPGLLRRGSWSEVDGRRLVDELVAEGRRFDALFAVNDETAIGAIRGLERAGLRVPEDVRVVGFDDVPLAGWMRPALTTVAAPPRLLGRTAVEALLALIDGRASPAAVMIPTSLVVRATCGCTQEEARAS